MNIRKQIKKDFGIDIPILGGTGQSIDNPLIIDPKYNDWSDVEYTFIRIINQARGRNYKVIKQNLFEHKGRKIDQIKIEIEGDKDNDTHPE